MTAIASSPPPAPAPTVPGPGPGHAARQGAADRTVFAALLDSLPGADAKTSSATAQERQRTAAEPKHGEPPQAQADVRSAQFDGALMALSPFSALPVAIPGGRPPGPANAPAPAAASTTAPKAEGKSAPQAVSADKVNATVGARLVGERAFLSSLSGVDGILGPLPAGAPPASHRPSVATASAKFQGSQSEAASLAAGAPIAPPAQSAAAARDGSAGGRKSETAPPPPSAHIAKPAAASPPKTGDGAGGPSGPSGSPDPGASGGQAPTLVGASGAQTSAALIGSPLIGLQDAPARAAEAAPRANAPSAASALQAPRIKEIDLDLSPSGLEDVSMTMRLAGDKLSVVIRAASSQTYGAIEGARDAIADRLAAIGQPLGSFIIQQTGANANGDTNANGGSNGEGDRGGGQQSGQRGDSGDPRSSGRGSSGGLGF